MTDRKEPPRLESVSPGQRVEHIKFGLGTVLRYEDGVAAVQFDDGLERDFSLSHAPLRIAEASATSEPGALNPAFIVEDGPSDTHAPGTWFAPFFQDYRGQVLERLPELLAEAEPVMASHFTSSGKPALPKGWPEGFALAWPEQRDGVRFILRITEVQNELCALFPAIETGTQLEAALDHVVVWESCLEAQVTVDFHGLTLCFFDTDFVSNRWAYRENLRAEYIVCGIAYTADIAQVHEFAIPADTPAVKAIRLSSHDDNADGPMVVSTEDMTLLIPMDQWDRNDYQFQGPVIDVKPVKVLDRNAWMLTVQVARHLDDDKELDLRILVTDLAWKGREPPQPGDCLAGTLWLQGRLWQLLPSKDWFH